MQAKASGHLPHRLCDALTLSKRARSSVCRRGTGTGPLVRWRRHRLQEQWLEHNGSHARHKAWVAVEIMRCVAESWKIRRGQGIIAAAKGRLEADVCIHRRGRSPRGDCANVFRPWLDDRTSPPLVVAKKDYSFLNNKDKCVDLSHPTNAILMSLNRPERCTFLQLAPGGRQLALAGVGCRPLPPAGVEARALPYVMPQLRRLRTFLHLNIRPSLPRNHPLSLTTTLRDSIQEDHHVAP